MEHSRPSATQYDLIELAVGIVIVLQPFSNSSRHHADYRIYTGVIRGVTLKTSTPITDP